MILWSVKKKYYRNVYGLVEVGMCVDTRMWEHLKNHCLEPVPQMLSYVQNGEGRKAQYRKNKKKKTLVLLLLLVLLNSLVLCFCYHVGDSHCNEATLKTLIKIREKILQIYIMIICYRLLFNFSFFVLDMWTALNKLV